MPPDCYLRIGRFELRGPFGFAVYLLLLPFLLTLFLVAGLLSIPATPMFRRWIRFKEDRFARQMREAGRILTVDECAARLKNGGTLVYEEVTFDGERRLWWTPETISETSPHPLCSEWSPCLSQGSVAFFAWCVDRFTHPVTGTALLVYEREFADAFPLIKQQMEQQRLVTVCHRFEDLPPAEPEERA